MDGHNFLGGKKNVYLLYIKPIKTLIVYCLLKKSLKGPYLNITIFWVTIAWLIGYLFIPMEDNLKWRWRTHPFKSPFHSAEIGIFNL